MDLDLKIIRHSEGTDVFECVEFGEAWLNFRGLLGLGGFLLKWKSF